MEESGAQTECWEQKQGLLHSTTPEGWANHLHHPSSGALDTPLPSSHIRTSPHKLTLSSVSKQGNLLFVLTFLCCSRNPTKALSEFFVWFLVSFFFFGCVCVCVCVFVWVCVSISIDWGRQRTLDGISRAVTRQLHFPTK